MWTFIFAWAPASPPPPSSAPARLEAVWSVLLPDVYQTGLLGILSVCWVADYLGRDRRATPFSSVYCAMFCLWLVGIAVTTSYVQLLPLWVAMGWLTVWPASGCSGRTRTLPSL